MATYRHSEIPALIGDVVEASKLPAKRRGTSIKPTVQELASALYEHGLEPNLLDSLLDLITIPSHLDQASLNALVNSMYPASAVSSDAVLKVVGALGRGELKPSFSIQAGLLRWLVMVYHVVENTSILSQAYAVLFNLLETAAIRPQLCHLLALITRRKHVRPFRIQALLNLSRQTGNEPPLTGLLRIYKDYYPEIIVAEAVRGKASAFKHPDLQWRERLGGIQRGYSERTADAVARPKDGFTVTGNGFGRGRSQRPSRIPAVHTSHAYEDSVTLEEVNSADRLVQNLEKIELPNQIAAVLADPLLQKFLSLRKDDVTSRRVILWVDSLLEDILSGNADTKAFVDAMEILEEYVSRVKETPPVVLNFLVKLFETWNGVDALAAILGIVSRSPLLSFDELHRFLFRPLERCLPGTPENHTHLLQTYSSLLRHWAAQLKSLDATRPDNLPVQSIRAVQAHASKITLTLIQAAPTLAARAAILDFYEQAAATTSDPVLEPSLRISTPPSHVIYLIFFSHSLAHVSRLSGVLARFKTAFDAAMGRDRSAYGAGDLRPFNGFLMDLCNCLWRGRAFNAGDTNALACMSSRAATARYQRYAEDLDDGDLALPLLFGLSFSPVLSSRSIACVRRLEDDADADPQGDGIAVRHAGPVTQSSLQRLASLGGLRLTWPEYRLQVLRALEDEGFTGIGALMRNVMKVLQTTPVSSKASRFSMG